MTQNKTLIYKKIPTGLPVAGKHLIIEDHPVDINKAPQGGIVLEILYTSFDPYLRGKIRNASVKSYSPAFEINHPITNSILDKVIKSNTSNFAEGDLIISHLAITKYIRIKKDIIPKVSLRKIQNPYNPNLGFFLSPLGIPSLTAQSSLYKINQPKKGKTIFISSTISTINQIISQVTKYKGLIIIGSINNNTKLDFITQELSFDSG